MQFFSENSTAQRFLGEKSIQMQVLSQSNASCENSLHTVHNYTAKNKTVISFAGQIWECLHRLLCFCGLRLQIEPQINIMLNDMSFQFALNWFHEFNCTWILQSESVVIGFRIWYNLPCMKTLKWCYLQWEMLVCKMEASSQSEALSSAELPVSGRFR